MLWVSIANIFYHLKTVSESVENPCYAMALSDHVSKLPGGRI